ncbi:MAG: DUF6550 family protein [Bacillota bacterium]
MTAGIAVIACVALCATVWPRSAEVGDLPTEPVKTAVTTEIEARSEGIPQILFSTESPAPNTEGAVESEQENLVVTSEEKTETAPPIALTSHAVSKSVPASTEPKPGDRTVSDGKPYFWIPGFGWIEYSGKQSVEVIAKDMFENGHKIGSMGGSEVPPRESTPPALKQLKSTDGEIYIMFVEVPEKNSTPPPYKPEAVSP